MAIIEEKRAVRRRARNAAAESFWFGLKNIDNLPWSCRSRRSQSAFSIGLSKSFAESRMKNGEPAVHDGENEVHPLICETLRDWLPRVVSR